LAIDALIRLGFRSAYWAARGWWFVTRPSTRGAAVAVWCGDRLLLVKTSYRAHYSLPGGFVKRGEAPAAAASRELNEEVHVSIAPDRLALAWEGTILFESRADTLSIFEASAAREPAIQVNGRELVWAGWKTAAEARALLLLPHLRAYLDTRPRPC